MDTNFYNYPNLFYFDVVAYMKLYNKIYINYLIKF